VDGFELRLKLVWIQKRSRVGIDILEKVPFVENVWDLELNRHLCRICLLPSKMDSGALIGLCQGQSLGPESGWFSEKPPVPINVARQR
jgi:hypothetical protein